MCLARRNLSPKAHRFLAVGNLCLCSGLMLGLFGKDLGLHHENLYDALRGFLLGLAITFNFCAMRFVRNCPEDRQ